MSPLFHVSELVRMGLEDEKTGVAYYSALAEKVQSPELRNLYADLAEQERGHQARFQKLLDELGDVHPTESHPGEYYEYLEAMLSGRAFPDEDTARSMADEKADDDEASIQLSIRFERNTLLLMRELQRMVPERHSRIVDDLIREEQGHLVQLTNARKKLAP